MSEKRKIASGTAIMLYLTAIERCPEHVFSRDELYQMFGSEEVKVTGTQQRYSTGEAASLIESIIYGISKVNAGEFDEDILDAVNYMKVSMDSVKHKLDIKKAREVFRIKELKKKYE